LDAIAQNFVSVNQRVRNGSRKVCTYAISEDEKALKAMTEERNKVGGELINALWKAKVQGTHKRWKGAGRALKSVPGRDKIRGLCDRLRRHREQIAIVLLVITGAKQTALDENMQGVKQNVVESGSSIIDESRQSCFQILDAIRRSNYSPEKP
jgi:hypothetical protein